MSDDDKNEEFSTPRGRGRGRGRGQGRGKGANRNVKPSAEVADFQIPDSVDEPIASALSALHNCVKAKLKSISETLNSHITDLEVAFTKSISDYATKVNDLQLRVNKLEKENVNLNNKIDELEQQQYVNDLVISGDIVKNTFKKVPNSEPAYDHSKWVVKNILTKQCGLSKDDYIVREAVKIIPKENKEKRSIIITVDDSDSKHAIMGAIVKKKSKTLAVNERLTPKRRGLVNDLLKLRKTSTTKCKVFSKNGIVQIKFEGEDFPRKIRSESDIKKLMNKLISAETRQTEATEETDETQEPN